MYEYKARYIENYDGDTIKFEVDLGFNISHKIIVRLLNIDCPEIKSKDKKEKELAIKAKNFTHSFLINATDITIKTYKDKTDKYGRYLAEVFITETPNPLNIELKLNGFTK